jgi:hypothetical protein
MGNFAGEKRGVDKTAGNSRLKHEDIAPGL